VSTANLTSADFGSLTKFAAIQSQITPTVLGYGIMEQPPPAADTQPGENSLVFNEREHFPWRRATWLRH